MTAVSPAPAGVLGLFNCISFDFSKPVFLSPLSFRYYFTNSPVYVVAGSGYFYHDTRNSTIIYAPLPGEVVNGKLSVWCPGFELQNMRRMR